MKDKLKKYHLQPAQLDQDWQAFIESSPQYCAYAEATFIHALNLPFHAYYCVKGQEKMAGVLVLVNQDETSIVHYGLLVHDGIFYRDLAHLNQAQKHSEQFAIQTYIAETLAERYKNITLTLHPSIYDIRPILWVNYHNDDAMFKPDIRYTSIVDIQGFDRQLPLDSIPLYKQASVARRQEIRYARKKQVSVKTIEAINILKQLYIKTMARQQITLEPEIIERMINLVVQLIINKKAVMYAAYTAQQELGSVAVFLLEKTCAHFLIGANDPNLRNAHTGTAVLWEAFYDFAEQGVQKVNLEGINSPERGWFKISFGGTITPYYQVSLVR